MALPKDMRLKGHRVFNYIHKNSIKYNGKLMIFKVAKSNPEILSSHKIKNTSNNLKVAIAISKKVSKKAVDRNKIRRILQEWLLNNIQKINNHKPYWLLVNLKFGDFCNDKNKLLEEFQNLMFKSRLIND
jgi:ribonuclease P protein component